MALGPSLDTRADPFPTERSIRARYPHNCIHLRRVSHPTAASHPTAGLSPISPERQPDEPRLLDFANRAIRDQNGDDFSMRLRILAIASLRMALDDVRDGARVEITVSRDNDRGLSLRDIHDALNSSLGLPLPRVAGKDQKVEGLIERWDFLQRAPFQVEVRNR
jgi:hypothetical protein